MRIVVVGTGVAGSIITYGLRDLAGVEVVAIEQVAPGGHDDAGTGLNVGPNALTILRRHFPSLHAMARDNSLPWRRWPISLTDGTKLMDLDLLDVAEEPGIRIRWADLYRLLRQPIGDLVRWRTEVTGVDRQADGRIALTLRNLDTGAATTLTDIDLVIAADGRYSKLRATVMGAPEPVFHGAVLARLLVPDTTGGTIDDYAQWFNGPHRLLSFKVPGDMIYATCTFPIPPEAGMPDKARDPDFLRSCYTPAKGKLDRPCQWLVDTITANVATIHWSRLQEIDAVHHDDSGRVLMVGDSGHGMVPTLGQGATQAVEDAAAAVVVIREMLAEGGSPLEACRRYAELRGPRVDFVRDLSRRASDTLLSDGDPVAGARWKSTAPFLDDLARVYHPPALV